MGQQNWPSYKRINVHLLDGQSAKSLQNNTLFIKDPFIPDPGCVVCTLYALRARAATHRQ